MQPGAQFVRLRGDDREIEADLVEPLGEEPREQRGREVLRVFRRTLHFPSGNARAHARGHQLGEPADPARACRETQDSRP